MTLHSLVFSRKRNEVSKICPQLSKRNVELFNISTFWNYLTNAYKIAFSKKYLKNSYLIFVESKRKRKKTADTDETKNNKYCWQTKYLEIIKLLIKFSSKNIKCNDKLFSSSNKTISKLYKKLFHFQADRNSSASLRHLYHSYQFWHFLPMWHILQIFLTTSLTLSKENVNFKEN